LVSHPGSASAPSFASCVYLSHGAPAWAVGDGLDYHSLALCVADGYGFTSGLFNVGAEYEHHPPGWAMLRAGITEMGAGSMWAHEPPWI
jgi:hypothetical protein